MLLADAVAVLHAAVVLFMLTGALLALRWPHLLLAHAPVALAVLAVNLAGAPCPLTTLELALRERAGRAPYDGGFLGHVLFGPLGLDVRATTTQLGMYVVAGGLNALGYGLLTVRALRGARARGRPRAHAPGPRTATDWVSPPAPRPGRR
ncbi:DUF2784 domain-containing protein [Geodermatophilus sp. URMC 63]